MGMMACSKKTTAPVLSKIVIAPTSPVNLNMGSARNFIATGTYSDHSAADISSKVTWISSNMNVATISSGGLVSGVSTGNTNITATLDGITSLPVNLSVIPPPELSSIVINPTPPAYLIVGSTQQFTAAGTYSDSSTANLISQVTWTSSDTSVAIISSGGLVTAMAPGSTNITASQSGVTSPVVGLNVKLLISISVTPTLPDILPVGFAEQFTALGSYSDGSTEDISLQVTWISSNASVAVTTQSGEIGGAAPGTSNITATLFGVTSPAVSVNVKLLSSITVTPNPPSRLKVGATRQFNAIGTYSDGSTADITSWVLWVSSDTSIATITSSGLATGVVAGDTNITATLGIASTAASLVVVAP